MNEAAASLGAESRIYRRGLAIAGGIYLAWWFAVEALLPGAYNPFASRVAVVAVVYAFLGLSYVVPTVRDHLRSIFLAACWLITLHYYYLFVNNSGDLNWVVGCFITVIGVNLGMFTLASLLWYSGLVLALSVGLVLFMPSFTHSVFLPGILTIVLQANVGMSARLRILRNLSKSNERFQLLLDATFEGILVHQEGRIRMVNGAATELFGYLPGELDGRNLLDLFPPDVRTDIAERMIRQGPLPFESVGLRKDGSTFDLELRGKNFEYDKRPARLVAMLRIDDRRQAERAKLAAEVMAEGVRARDEFISVASHELRTPLTSLTLRAHLHSREIENGMEGLDPLSRLRSFVALVERQANRLTRLIEAMLDVSRIAAGKFRLDRENFDLASVAREVAEMPHLSFAANPAPIRVDAPPHLEIRADPLRVEQVLENLLGNALKYGDGKPVDLRVFPEGDGPDARAVIEVADHGVGIAAEDVDKIFERFERIPSAENIGGLGLGLYITRQIVQAHGGEIGLVSKPGEGSVFRVRLPLE